MTRRGDRRSRRGRTRTGRIAAPILLPVLLIASCGENTSEPIASTLDCALPAGPVVFAASPRTNAAAPTLSQNVHAVLQHALDTEAYVAVLDTDGAPTQKEAGRLALRARNAPARQDRVATVQRALLESLDTPANDPEADPLAALETAARTVRAQAASGTVVLIDSGLQTTGALRYQSGDLLLASGNDVVAHLQARDGLPDLTGITLILSGIGDTAGDQQRLDTSMRSRLIEHWSAIAMAAGAACVDVDEYPLTTAPPPGLPPVATIELPKPSTPEIDVVRPIALREDVVGFRDNSAQLRDPEQARRNLATLARQVRERDLRVTLTGTTASAGTERGRRELSKQRAEAVKQVLVDAGVDPRSIVTEGVGIHHARHVVDVDQQGHLIPAKAVRNRAVFVSVS